MLRHFRHLFLWGLLFCTVSCVRAQTTITFQNGFNGYAGTQDCDIRQGSPDFNTQNWQYNDVAFCDASDPGQNNATQIMLRFDNIFGANAVPTGATIMSATLQLTTAPLSRNGQGNGGAFHRMLHDWNANTVTWNSLTNGVSTDNIESMSTTSFQAGQVPNVIQPGPIVFDATADVRAWASGQANYGWAALPLINGTDGWGIQTSDQSIIGDRPKLTVTYIVAPEPSSLTMFIGIAFLGGNILVRRFRKLSRNL